MENFDLIIGINSDRLNLAVSQLFNNQGLHSQLFTGSRGGVYEGFAYNVSWRIQEAPQLELRAPSQAEWDQSIKADGTAGIVQDNAFITNLNALNVSLTQSDTTKQTTLPVKAICKATVNGDSLSLEALAVVVDLSGSSSFDLFVFQSVLIPEVLGAITSAIKGIQIPKPSFMGISLTPPTVGILSNMLIVAFNLVQKAQPVITNISLPNQPFFILSSQDLMQHAVNYLVTQNIQGKTFNKSGREGAIGYSAEYHTNGRVNGVTVRTTSNPALLKAVLDISLTASAGISTPLGYIIQGGNVVYQGLQTAGKEIEKHLNPSNW